MNFKATILGLTIFFHQFANVHANTIDFLKTINLSKDAKEISLIGSVLASSLFLENMKAYPKLKDLAAIFQISCGLGILKKSKDYYSFEPSIDYKETKSVSSSQEENKSRKNTFTALLQYIYKTKNEIKKTKYSTVIVGSGIIFGIGLIFYGLNNLIKNNQHNTSKYV